MLNRSIIRKWLIVGSSQAVRSPPTSAKHLKKWLSHDQMTEFSKWFMCKQKWNLVDMETVSPHWESDTAPVRKNELRNDRGIFALTWKINPLCLLMWDQHQEGFPLELVSMRTIVLIHQWLLGVCGIHMHHPWLGHPNKNAWWFSE